MAVKMSVISRVIFGESLVNLDRKLGLFQKAIRSAELNALLHYAKHYEGKRGKSGETLPEIMEKILNAVKETGADAVHPGTFHFDLNVLKY